MYAKNKLLETEHLQQTPSSFESSISDSLFFAKNCLEADIMSYNKVETGEYGENYVLYKLSELRIPAVKLPPTFDFDIYTNNNLRIEVKTGRLLDGRRQIKGKWYLNKRWTFANHNISWKCDNGSMKSTISNRDRHCDFFICLCLDDNDKIVREYIIPKDVVGKKRLICIGQNNKKSYTEQYKDRWDLIAPQNNSAETLSPCSAIAEDSNKDLTATQQVATPKSASQTSLNPDIKSNQKLSPMKER